MIRTLGAVLAAVTLAQNGYGDTTWSEPVAIHNGTAEDGVHDTTPRVARDANGGLAVAWIGQSRTGTTTITESRHSDVFITYLPDAAGSWSTPKQLSSPAFYNGEVDIAAGDPGQFYCVWNSGDIFSSHRMHVASIDNQQLVDFFQTGAPFTPDEMGFFAPHIIAAGGNLVLTKSSRDTSIDNYLYDGYLWTRDKAPGIDVWTETARIFPPPPAMPWLPYHSVLAGTPASDGANVLVPFAVAHKVSGSQIYHGIWVASSTNSGMTWNSTGSASPLSTPAAFPVVSTDRNGTWILAWLTKRGPGLLPPTDGDSIHFQKSTDNGATWSSPHAMTVQNGLVDHLTACHLTTDGAGHWLAVFQGQNSDGTAYGTDGDIMFTWSADNGANWSPISTVTQNPESDTAIEAAPRAVFLGEGKWAAVWSRGEAGTDADIVMATMENPAASIGDWQLYVQ